MSTITTLASSDTGATSRITINNNFTNLNTDKMEGPAASVDSELPLFSGTGGKTLKRASTTGIVKLASGVVSTVTAPSGAIVGDSDSQTLTNKTIAGGSNSVSGISETMLSTSDITTLDVSTTKHGFAPKAPNVAAQFLNGVGAYSVPTFKALTGIATKNLADANATNPLTITHGLGRTPSMMRITAYYFATSRAYWCLGTYDGTNYATIFMSTYPAVTSNGVENYNGSIVVLTDLNNSTYASPLTSAQVGTVTTWNSTTITVTWAKAGSPSGSVVYTYELY